MRATVEITSKLFPDAFEHTPPGKHYAIVRENLLKSLKRLGRESVLQWAIERVQNSEYVDEVLVVTSIERSNLRFIGYAPT